MLLIFMAFLLGIFPFSTGTSMRCTKISSTNIFDEYDYGNITGSAVLSVYKRGSTQYLAVSDVDVINYAKNFSVISYCVAGGCTSNLTSPFETPIENTTFAMDAYFTQSGFEFFHGIVDDETFFGLDGTMYSLDNLCTTETSNQSNLIDKEVHCCLAFEPVPQAPANSPRCTKFQSRSSILNVDDNYSIFATLSMNLALNGNNLTAFGNFSAAASGSNYTTEFWANDYWICDNELGSSEVTCYFILFPDGDSKMLFSIEFVKWDSNGGTGFGGVIGRILIRDGMTLMEEGKPFTSQDNCFYRNFPFGGNSNQIVNNQLCCTEFESQKSVQDGGSSFDIPKILDQPPKRSSGTVKYPKFDHGFNHRQL